MNKPIKLLFLAVCILFVIHPAVVSSHSEHGPYVDFEAPGFWWLEVPCAAEGLGRVKLQDGFGFIDKSGNVLLRGYKDTKGFSEGLAAVSDENGRWGYIEKTGSVIIPYQFEHAQNFSDGLARVLVNNHWG